MEKSVFIFCVFSLQLCLNYDFFESFSNLKNMKINFAGDRGFVVEVGKKVRFGFDVNNEDSELDFLMVSSEEVQNTAAKKVLNLPGEFEISDVLITGLFTDERSNTVFKTFADDISLVHMGHVQAAPKSEFFEKLGESVDVLLVHTSEDFKVKALKDLVNKIDPRVLIVSGDTAFLPEAKEAFNAKILEQNSLKVSRSKFSDDQTEAYIVSA